MSIRVTATSLAASTASGLMEVELFFDPPGTSSASVTDDLINLALTTRQPLTGTMMGENCTDRALKFIEGSPAFSTATPPYAGSFRPFGTAPPATGSGNFDNYEGKLLGSSDWRLFFKGLDDDVRLQCWIMEFELTRQAPPPLQQDVRDN